MGNARAGRRPAFDFHFEAWRNGEADQRFIVSTCTRCGRQVSTWSSEATVDCVCGASAPMAEVHP